MTRNFLLAFLCLCIFGKAYAQSEINQPTRIEPRDSFSVKPDEQATCQPNLTPYIYISPRKIKAFTEELNRFARCGYRLEKSNKIPLGNFESSEMNADFFGVMKLNLPHKFEYQWFEVYSPGQAQTRMNYRADQGFYFKASHPFQLIGENRDGDFADPVTNKYRSIYGTFLIFEKRDDEIIKREYRVLDTVGVGKTTRENNQNKLNDYLKKGFSAVGFVKERERFGIVMEKGGKDAAADEYQIIDYNFGLTKKLSEFSKTGFLPEFLTSYVALVKKEPNAAIEQRSYKIFENFKNIFEDPSLLADKYYLTSGAYYINSGDLKPSLLFVNITGSKSKYEYKLLKMSDVAGRSKSEDESDALIKPPTDEMLSEFQNLLKQGYIIREVSASKEIYILFERAVKPFSKNGN